MLITDKKPFFSFSKMEGLGNDFIVLDAIRDPAITSFLTPIHIQKLSDRHYGVGCDQVLLISSSNEKESDFEYRIFNANGSETGQCGNGARCIGRYIWETGLVPVTQKKIVLKTITRTIDIWQDSSDFTQIRVNMGLPSFDLTHTSSSSTDELLKKSFQKSPRGVTYRILQVNNLKFGLIHVGNPHAVALVSDIENAPVLETGKKLQQPDIFQKGINVGFMQLLDRCHIRLRVYERGAGETLACGSGACAAVVIGCIRDILDHSVEVELRGGQLKITWEGERHPIWMTGPANFVFQGQWAVA